MISFTHILTLTCYLCFITLASVYTALNQIVPQIKTGHNKNENTLINLMTGYPINRYEVVRLGAQT